MIAEGARLSDFQAMTTFVVALLAYGACAGVIIVATTRSAAPLLRLVRQQLVLRGWERRSFFDARRRSESKDSRDPTGLPTWLALAIGRTRTGEMKSHISTLLKRSDEARKDKFFNLPTVFGPDEQFMYAIQTQARATLQRPSGNMPLFLLLTHQMPPDERNVLIGFDWLAKAHPDLLVRLSGGIVGETQAQRAKRNESGDVAAATAAAAIEDSANQSLDALLDNMQRRLGSWETILTWAFTLSAALLLTAIAERETGVRAPSPLTWLTLSATFFAVSFNELSSAALSRLRR